MLAALDAALLLVILKVALGLGFVIFVHELGHFLVAKACGVRCDKFMLGFDIGGLKLSRKWGETEYGVGVLPLGGYVKMFGQDDNVANQQEEIEASKTLAGSPDAKQIVGPGGEKVWVHKRSYMAKSVPQRMAIISAGVIMNVIFALLMAWVAFGLGVPERPCVVGSTTPGGAAWRAGLLPGDLVVRLNDVANPTFKQLQEGVLLGDADAGLRLNVRGEGDAATRELTIKPDAGPVPRIGVEPGVSTRLAAKEAVRPHTPAAKAEGGFRNGDQIVELAGEKVDSYADLARVLAARKGEPLTYTVIRGGRAPVSNPFGPVSGGERVEVTVDPNPMERLGIVPRLGPVVAIVAGSPADKGGLRVGDELMALNGVAIGAAPEGEEAADPVTLDDRLATLAQRGETATLNVRRGDEKLDVVVTPTAVAWPSFPGDTDDPVAYNTIGVACHWEAEVQALVAGSPAAEADVRAGDRIVSAKLLSSNKTDGLDGANEPIELGPKSRAWPLVVLALQDKSPDLKVKLTLQREGKTHDVTLKPAPSGDYFFSRGVALAPLKELKTASSVGEAFTLAWDETKNSLGGVLRFLQKIGGQIPVTALGGPITIAKVAGQSAYEGLGALLISLTMLSANLAILNFLPIPVLDGGHMMFLLWEGVTGRPANERVMMTLHGLGFAFLVGLMGFVFALDLGWIPRG